MSEKIGDNEANKLWFIKEIDNLKGIFFGKEMSVESSRIYARRLAHCRRDIMTEVLNRVCTWKKFPLLGDLVDEYSKLEKRDKHVRDAEIRALPAPPEDKSSFRAAVMGVMHLYYNNGMEDLAMNAECIKEAYRQLYPEEKSFDFNKLQAKIPKELVMRYIAAHP